MFKMTKAERREFDELRGNYSASAAWYAALVHWGQERAVGRRIADIIAHVSGQEVLLPIIALADASADDDTREMLFGGYVFFRCRMDDPTYLSIAEHRSVFSILGKGFRIPSTITEKEMRSFKSVLAMVPKAECLRLTGRGTQVLVVAGLLKGMRGRILEASSTQLKLETTFSFLSAESGVCVTVPRHQVIVLNPDPVSV